MATIKEQEREVQKSYGIEHSVDPTLEYTMLDSKASDLDKEEGPEVLSLLPPYEGKSVLELGAGVGRFTGEVAKKAGRVTAIDFIESIVKKNEAINGHHKNVKFMCADVTSPDLNFPEGSFDLIFSNWLLMHLSDSEVENLAKRMVKWLEVGGCIVFRESCFHQSATLKQRMVPAAVQSLRPSIGTTKDKPALFRSFYKWVKPGGKVLISDYCKSAGTPSADFSEYIKQRGYDLHSVEAYGQMLRDAGFVEVIAEDRTDQFMKVLEKELDAVEKDRETFTSDFSGQDYNDIVGGWKSKLARTTSGEQRWGLFTAKKR